MRKGLLTLALCPMMAWTQNTITVEADAAPIKYNTMIFGHFIEHFDTQVYGASMTRNRSLPTKTDSAPM